MKNILIIAFHFPPYGGGSGFLRTLKFCRYLPALGWQPVVLTAHPRAYERSDPSQLSEVPAEVLVLRAFAMDTQRHLAIRGRYLGWLALPDRWAAWCLGAVPSGWRAIRRYRADLIFSTFPIATAVLIGLILHRLTSKPWVVDFRDPITEDEYPTDPFIRRIHRRIESWAIERGSLFLFTSPRTLQMYLERYPALDPGKCVLLPNGFDEEDFQGLTGADVPRESNRRPTRLLHAGLLYPEYRHPGAFFQALAGLKQEGRISAKDLQVDLRACGSESTYATLIRELGIEDLVHLLPALPYQQSLQDGMNADGLLLFQGAPCSHQIPAKAYEYLRLNKPILALTPPDSDTAGLMREVGGATILEMADPEKIYRILPEFLDRVRQGCHSLPDRGRLSRYTRENLTRELAGHLVKLTGARARKN